MLVPLPWLAEFTPLGGRDGAAVAAALVSVGLEEEAVIGSGVEGPLVAGLVLEATPEPQKNGKTINWCQVDVGERHGGVRGIVCGAHNFAAGDKVAVALPGAVLPGPFPISSRKTYGHISDGMICSERELGLGEDHGGILVLSRIGLDPPVGADLIPLLHLDEQTVDVNVTPDRGYCFSIRGVAREFSHATGERFSDPALIRTPPASPDGFPVSVDDAVPPRGRVGCDRFTARIVRGCAAAGPSPTWMRRRLAQAGMRPISLAVDVTNYVMLELGQPLHAYDLAGVAAPMVVRRARAGERLVTLDGVDRALDPEDLLITDSPGGVRASRVLGLAGVMGGESSEVTAETRDLLIEAAHFEPVSVSRTARRHKLGSEAARRFERGVDPELGPRAAQRVVDLLLEYGGGEADLAVTDVGNPMAPAAVPFDPGYPERLVGVAYTQTQVKTILEAIGCEVATSGGPAGVGAAEAAESVGAGGGIGPGAAHAANLLAEPGGIAGAGPWLVTPPSWRPDLTRAVDLVEEVARLAGHADVAAAWRRAGAFAGAGAPDLAGGAAAAAEPAPTAAGYAGIPSVLPEAPAGPGLTKSQRLRRSAARSLADFGLVEVLSYPFVGEATFDAFGYAAEDVQRRAVRLANPLDAAAPLLRTEILQTLLATLRRNVGRGLADVGLFELGLVTRPGPKPEAAPMPRTDARPSAEELEELLQAVPPQPRHIAGAMAGARQAAGVWGPGRPWDWADAVEAARLIGRAVNMELTASQAAVAPFHPGRCAAIAAGGLVVGHAGELDPRALKALGLPERTVAFELDLDHLVEAAPDIRPARPVSAHPVAKEDLAFVVDRDTPVAALVQAVRRGAGEVVEAAGVFDVYQGDQ
ncbi:MAG: phenylalanine--tRNA ligase subunit beta, partial [Bifidobacteriaceae bacterium]|nr:phenylalanine--tRNA ligase subunit beta [Bifidobacteriaceae bacterium]